MLLFEKLVDAAPLQSGEASAATEAAEAARSIRRELARLLDTRRPIGAAAALHDKPRTVRDYGIPDASTLSPYAAEDRAVLAQAIRDAITVFEPRLAQPSVEVQPSASGGAGLHVIVGGRLAGQAERARMVFGPGAAAQD